MRPKAPYPTTFDKVRITRENSETACIEYLRPGVSSTLFVLGPKLKQMTDHEVFHRFNEGLKASRLYRKAHPYVAKEVPKGKQQLHRQYHRGPFELQGDVLRCIIGVKNDGEVVFEIDNKELNASEFSSLFHAHAGWGLRVCVVPADELSREPRIEVLAPKGTRR